MEDKVYYGKTKRLTLSDYCIKRSISYKTGLKHFKEKNLESVMNYETDNRGDSVRHYVIVENKNFNTISKLNEIKNKINLLIKDLKN